MSQTHQPSDGPKMVDPDELKRIWMRMDAVHMVDDHQQDLRIVRLDDGREYATRLSDIEVTR